MPTFHPALPHTVNAFILDWAGTTLDFGCHAPVVVFRKAFAELGVDVTEDEARGPMGLAKWDHLNAMLTTPSVAARFHEKHGRSGTDADVDAMYERFLPLQVEEVAHHAQLVPGFLTLVRYLEAKRIPIGSTTGYPKVVMDRLVPLAHAQGYAPLCALDATDVRFGRPKPWLIFRAMELLDVCPANNVVVVDDTPVGVRAGVAAGAFTVGVVDSANAMGMTLDALERFKREDPAGYRTRYATVERGHLDAGASLVVPTIASLLVP